MLNYKFFPILLVFPVFFILSCTESNPDYDPDYVPLCKLGSLSCTEDLRSVTACIETDDGTRDYSAVYDCWTDTSCVDGFCIPEEPETCEVQSDCETSDSSLICTALNSNSSSVDTYCITPPNPEGKESGRACSVHSQCKSGWCFKKTCFTPCAETEDCPFNDVCTTLNVTINGVKTTLKGCAVPTKNN